MKSVIKLIMLYLCIVLCLGFSNDAYAAKGLKSIKLSKKSITIHQSYSFRVSIKSNPVKAIKKVTVKSSDNSIVKVSKVSKRRFYIRACEPGNAKITVKATGKNKKVRYAYLKVNVKENSSNSNTSSDVADTTQSDDISTESPADKKQDSDISSSTTEDKTADITAPEAQVEMFVGNAHSMSPNDNRIKWESLNSNIATVSESGEIVAKSVGETNLKGTVNGQSYSCKVVVYPKGEVITNLKGEYQYCIPDKLKGYDFREKAYSSAHEFRDILVKKYDQNIAGIYNAIVETMIDILYSDDVDWNTNIDVIGIDDSDFKKYINVDRDKYYVFSDLMSSIQKDIPLLPMFVDLNISNDEYGNTRFESKRSLRYIEQAGIIKSVEGYNVYRNKTMAKLEEYRNVVKDLDDDIDKLELAAGMFDYGGLYGVDGDSIFAIVNKHGNCGSCAGAFSIIANAIDVPAYSINVGKWIHGVTLVKPNGGKLSIIDTVFSADGERYPRVTNILGTPYETDIEWYGGDYSPFGQSWFQGREIIEELGGLSSNDEVGDAKTPSIVNKGTLNGGIGYIEEYNICDVRVISVINKEIDCINDLISAIQRQLDAYDENVSQTSKEELERQLEEARSNLKCNEGLKTLLTKECEKQEIIRKYGGI